MNKVNPNEVLQPAQWRNPGFAAYSKDNDYGERRERRWGSRCSPQPTS